MVREAKVVREAKMVQWVYSGSGNRRLLGPPCFIVADLLGPLSRLTYSPFSTCTPTDPAVRTTLHSGEGGWGPTYQRGPRGPRAARKGPISHIWAYLAHLATFGCFLLEFVVF